MPDGGSLPLPETDYYIYAPVSRAAYVEGSEININNIGIYSRTNQYFGNDYDYSVQGLPIGLGWGYQNYRFIQITGTTFDTGVHEVTIGETGTSDNVSLTIKLNIVAA